MHSCRQPQKNIIFLFVIFYLEQSYLFIENNAGNFCIGICKNIFLRSLWDRKTFQSCIYFSHIVPIWNKKENTNWKNIFLIYLFLPIFFLVCNNARSSEKCSAKIAKMVRKNICITICKESYKSVLEKAKSFWCDVGGAWRHAAQAHHRQEEKKWIENYGARKHFIIWLSQQVWETKK